MATRAKDVAKDVFLDEHATRPGRDTFTTIFARAFFIGISLLFLAALLFAPLATVFAMAFEKGYEAFLASFKAPSPRLVSDKTPPQRPSATFHFPSRRTRHLRGSTWARSCATWQPGMGPSERAAWSLPCISMCSRPTATCIARMIRRVIRGRSTMRRHSETIQGTRGGGCGVGIRS